MRRRPWHGNTPVDTKWVDTDKASVVEPMQIRSRIVAREFKSDDRPDLYAGTPPLEVFKVIMSIAAKPTTEKPSQSCTSTCHVSNSMQWLRGLC